MEKAIAAAMTFPPLDKGGPGGVVTRASATGSRGVKVLKYGVQKADGVLEMIGSEVLARWGETGKS